MSNLLLFQGESITDAGRNRQNPGHLGGGYVLLANAWLDTFASIL